MFFENAVMDTLARAILLSATALCWTVIVVRFIGLRSFSKMSAFDFVVTVAVGSLLAGASQATVWSGYAQAALAISTLLGMQYIVARLRRRSARFKDLIENTPILLMRDGEILHKALDATRVAEGDLVAKLREANVHDFTQVRAVVLETTGDISVLHGPSVSSALLKGVKAIE